MKKQILFLFLLSLLVGSCKNQLSEDEAQKQISNAENFPIIQSYEIPKNFTKDHNSAGNGVSIVVGGDDFEKTKKAIEHFQAIGLLNLTEQQHREESTSFLLGTTIRTWAEVNVLLTEEGKKYLLQENDKSYKIKLWDTDINRVTRIEEIGEKERKADYYIVNKNRTPFGEYFSDKSNIITKSVNFYLYDDGWRIQSNSIKRN